ncbi:hypothetical protein LJC59_09520 [Desulfovibrio sp. OttesenSCG-928-A18]|nr:hypothetical protein [Desulfovibrio sp. OttesenSCG-928-A18]
MAVNNAGLVVAAAKMSLEKVKGDIVTQTLDKLNPIGGNKKKSKNPWLTSMSDTYDLSKSVLSAAYSAKGIGINTKS